MEPRKGLPPAEDEPVSEVFTPARPSAWRDSREDFERVLDAADALIAEHPVDGITVAGIAERASVSRSSVELFFPTVAAIYNELARRYLHELLERLRGDRVARRAPSWQAVSARLVDRAVAYYNARPVARMLLLGTGLTPELRVIDRNYDERFAIAVREVLAEKWPLAHEQDHDPLRMAVILTTAVLEAGVCEGGEISDFHRLEAQRASVAYLESCLQGRAGHRRERAEA